MSWHVGEVWPIVANIINKRATPNTLVDPEHVTIKVTQPNNTVTALSVAHIETGVYEGQILLTEPGKWSAETQATGSYLGAKPCSINVLP